MLFKLPSSERTRFEAWMERQKETKPVEKLDWSKWNYRGENREERFASLINEVASSGSPQIIRVHQHDARFVLGGEHPSESFHESIDFSVAQCVISNFGFRHLYLNNCPKVELTNLWVENLHVDSCGDVSMTNCHVGTLHLSPNAARILDVARGAVLNINCNPPGNAVPFSGAVHFHRDVFFSRKPGTLLKSPQPYRNMRAHMLKLENTPMVSLFHTLEQATERTMDGSAFNRAISKAYEVLSDYGSSALRPFIWFCALLFVTGIATFLLGTSPASEIESTNWQSVLKGDTSRAEILRAFVLTWQSTLNPLGIFGTKGLVVAKSEWLALWLTIHGLLSAILVALFIFAVRRRFKMS